MPAPVEQTGTPFLAVESFSAGAVSLAADVAPAPATRTPFLSVYEVAEPAEDPAAGEYLTFLNELYDEELDDGLFELMDEAATLYQAEADGPGGARLAVEQHFRPLEAEAQAFFDHLVAELGDRDPSGLDEAEVDAAVDGYQPATSLSPAFEHLFGGFKSLARKVVGAARAGIGKLAKFGLAKLFAKIKAALPQLLRGVLTAGITKLPAELRPIAQTLSQRLPFMRETEEEPADASVDVTQLQHEFNRQVADLAFADNEAAQDLELARAGPPAPVSTLAEFERAQEEFVTRLAELRDGEDPTPHVEGFLAALGPVLRTAFTLSGGRKPVVNKLGDLIGKLVTKFVGPRYAPQLSRALADVGLRMIGLEVPAEEDRRGASAAVAATVVDTVRRVSALPEQVLADPTLLEAFTVDAFEQAAAAYLPPILPDAIYRERPDLLPSGAAPGCWVPRGRYRKFSRVLDARITPQLAEAVPTVGGVTLADFLHDQLGVLPGESVQAEVHLYEAVPGTTLPDLVRSEAASVPGLAGGGEQAASQLHPLTPDAAGLLLGAPLLGRAVSAKAMGSRRAVDLGQRFYHLAVPGRRPLLTPRPGRSAAIRRHSGVHLTLDFRAGVIRVRLFLSETRTQKLAVRLRQAGHPGLAAVAFGAFLDRTLRAALGGQARGRVRLVHEGLTPEEALGAGLRLLAPVTTEALAVRLREWLIRGLADFFKTRAARFVTAAEDPKDGVTLVVTLRDVPGMATLRRALKGGVWTPPAGGTPAVDVDVVAGYDRG